MSFGGVGGAASKALDAIVVPHCGGEVMATADHIERFYFTRAYGLTRWERWQNNSGTPRAEGCNGAAEFVVFQRDSGARILQCHYVPLTVTSSPTRVTSLAFTVDPATDRFRITLYLNSPHLSPR